MTADTMTAHTQNHRDDHGFLIGLLTGTFVGAGLAIWLAPRAAAELRQRVGDSAKELGSRVSERYEELSTRVGEAVEDLTAKGQDVRDAVADTVARGAHEVVRRAHEVEGGALDVERYATEAKSNRDVDARPPALADGFRSRSPRR